jgi:hypothetical protein
VARTSKRALAKEKVAGYLVSITHVQKGCRSSIFMTSRNVVNILLYVAEQSKQYYPATEIPAMLSTFIPMLTQDVRFMLTAPSCNFVTT